MDEVIFQERLRMLAKAIGPNEPFFRDPDFWETAGTTKLDHELARLADLCLESSSPQQTSIRLAVNPRAEWNLVAYVRRLAIMILQEKDPIWLRRGLAIACLENGSFDFRDSIVSLVILRSAAEQSGIDPIQYFDDALGTCEKEFVHVIENARDHKPKDVRDILREFGPPALKPKRRNRSNKE